MAIWEKLKKSAHSITLVRHEKISHSFMALVSAAENQSSARVRLVMDARISEFEHRKFVVRPQLHFHYVIKVCCMSTV